jgi:hypothetical protein
VAGGVDNLQPASMDFPGPDLFGSESLRLPPSTVELLRRQDGVARLRDLVDAGLTEAAVRAHVEARRWQRMGSRCVIAHNSAPTRSQWRWVAVLDPPGPCALAGFTALELEEFHYFGTEPQLIHTVIRRGAEYHRFPGVKVHESRRFDGADVLYDGRTPHLPAPRSALDAAAWQPNPRYASGVLAAVVQQRVCTVEQLAAELPRIGRIRHKQRLRLTIADIGGGAEALSELDVASMCRRFGIPEPDRQRFRRDRAGRKRFLDCEWELDDGSVLVLEVDGSHHLLVEHWEADMKRERKIVGRRRTVIRCSANEARFEQRELVADLLALGVRRLAPPELGIASRVVCTPRGCSTLET